MEVPSGFVRRDEAGGIAVIRADLAGLPSAEFWRDGRPLPGARGRGGVAEFDLAGSAGPVRVVARDYRRGGALGALLGTRYYDAGRAARELEVTIELQERGVPVVTPVAALSRRVAAGAHRLRLLTVAVEGARPLPAFVLDEPMLRRAAVAEAGRVVSAAFGAGLIHRDLHPDNLIARRRTDGAGEVEVLLLDLDRATLVDSLPVRSREAMLLRMGRYLRRHGARVEASATDVARFLAACGLDRSERRSLVSRLAPRLARVSPRI